MKLPLPALFAFLVFLTGCAKLARVDYERTAIKEMASYRAYAVDSREAQTDDQDVIFSPIVDRRIERAIQTELAAKGFWKNADNPDFRVTFNTVSKPGPK